MTPANDTHEAARGAGHTRGPWLLCHDGDYDESTGRDFRWPWQIVGANDEIIVDFTGGCDVSDADADLIAAAPELLAALEMALTQTEGWIGAAQDAIAKAKRGTP